MKKFALILLVLSVFFTAGCGNDDDNQSTNPLLHGRWLLKGAGGGIAGDIYYFNNVVWEINTRNQTLVVRNNMENSEWDVFETGTYNYDIVPNTMINTANTCNEVFKVGNNTIGWCMYLSDNNRTLTFGDPISDGFSYTLERE